MAAETSTIPNVHTAEQHEEDEASEHLMLDPRPREEMNHMVMEAMTHLDKKVLDLPGAFWIAGCGTALWRLGQHDRHRHGRNPASAAQSSGRSSSPPLSSGSASATPGRLSRPSCGSSKPSSAARSPAPPS